MSSVNYYKLADIIIKIETDFDYNAEKGYMKDFLIKDPLVFDYNFEFKKIDNINNYIDNSNKFVGQYEKFHYYQNNNGQDYCLHLHDNYYHAITTIDEKKGYCYYISQDIIADEINRGNYLENFICLEKILMNFKCMVLHSCHIHYNNEAILFSAPSGTGKSTQGELWNKYENAEIINGDRTAIRKINNNWYAFGLPFCGSSQINKNKNAKINSVIILKQNKVDEIEDMSTRQAFFSIYSEVTVNSWNSQYVNNAIDWVNDLITDIPIYLFKCTKTQDAVTTLKKYLENNRRKVNFNEKK